MKTPYTSLPLDGGGLALWSMFRYSTGWGWPPAQRASGSERGEREDLFPPPLYPLPPGEEKYSLSNQPIRLPGLKLGVCSGLILSGAFNPDFKIGVWRRRTYQESVK